ncbi:DUF2939 domain-containing protein [Acetobacter sp. TBRC 12305]|uniref:DUF2939 domain-containing protein n=2 Tax=Acetobacter garciniae TaxID=2817435 RepID=A0A939KKW0_9PROT|nr:DUF2939 domain-containing protein [Acetobacter garciniae]MBX0343322.1 DUF2939 domain-containing protein [Acetobacter garciniae]
MNSPADLTPRRTSQATAGQTARRLCILSATLACGLYLASPFMTLLSVASDLRSHDMVSLGHVINWGSLDASIKKQALNGLHMLSEPPADELPEFGSSFAGAAVSNAVDTSVNQANLGTLVDQALLETAGPTRPSLLSVAAVASRTTVRFTRPDEFVAAVPLPGHEHDTPLRIQMRIEGWHWKITAVEFPVSRGTVVQAATAPHNA